MMRPDAGILSTEMAGQLALTDDQKAKLFDLRAEQLSAMKALRDEFRTGDVSPNNMRAKREELQANHENDLKAILTTEQYEKLVTIRTERRKINREGRPGRDGKGPGMQREDRGQRGGQGTMPNRQNRRPGGQNQ